MSPRVTIVLPTYNGARHLAEAIDSCLAQTFADWELIVVDDASTDDSGAIAETYARREARVRVVRHSVNRQLPASLNTGFAASRGQLLTWTSDDNAYRPQALETLVAFVDERPRIDLVYSAYTVVDDDGHILDRVRARPLATLIERNCVGASFLYRRKVYEGIGDYAEDLRLAEDYDYWLRAAARFRLAPLDRDLYLYRAHSASLTSISSDAVKLRMRDRALARNLPALAWVPAARKGELFRALARRAWGRGDRATAMVYGLRSLRWAPRQAAETILRRLTKA